MEDESPNLKTDFQLPAKPYPVARTLLLGNEAADTGGQSDRFHRGLCGLLPMPATVMLTVWELNALKAFQELLSS